MSNSRPYVLSIAGYDPSGGAGVLADVKTFEQHKTLGLAVTTCLTGQNEDSFEWVEWYSEEWLQKQLEPLRNYDVKAVKIGLIEKVEILKIALKQVKETWPDAYIVWDPVMKASAGTDFHKGWNWESIKEILDQVNVFTPNKEEYESLGDSGYNGTAVIYVKGGDDKDNPGRDVFYIDGLVRQVNPKPGNYYEKHGSGCIFSAALAANLAKGYPLHKAILRSKKYISGRLKSNKSKLAYHV